MDRRGSTEGGTMRAVVTGWARMLLALPTLPPPPSTPIADAAAAAVNPSADLPVPPGIPVPTRPQRRGTVAATDGSIVIMPAAVAP